LAIDHDDVPVFGRGRHSRRRDPVETGAPGALRDEAA
jgi:hypothetical protein